MLVTRFGLLYRSYAVYNLFKQFPKRNVERGFSFLPFLGSKLASNVEFELWVVLELAGLFRVLRRYGRAEERCKRPALEPKEAKYCWCSSMGERRGGT